MEVQTPHKRIFSIEESQEPENFDTYIQKKNPRSSIDLIKVVHDGVIGRDYQFEGPFGKRHV